MKTSQLSCGLAILGFAIAWPATTSRAADGDVNLTLSNNTVMLKVDGDHDDDWWIQTSTNLTTWTMLTNFGTLISGNETNAPWRSAGALTNSQRFYRALQTAGLFDPSVFHTVNLTFTQANWGTALANARTSNTNIYCSLLTLDNGATNYSVGARYKGNSSYDGSGTKKSINLDIDWVDTNANLMDYTTINLNNAAGDETIMREPLFFTIMNQYTPCPKGSMARVHINGSLWGVYSLIQQENAQLIREFFPSTDGDRWRAPNAAGGVAVRAAAVRAAAADSPVPTRRSLILATRTFPPTGPITRSRRRAWTPTLRGSG